MALIKTAILLQCRRIFALSRSSALSMYFALYLTMAAIIIFYAVGIIFNIVQCTPREAIWNPLVQDAFCFNRYAIFQAAGVFNVVSDFAILTIPILVIWRLHVVHRKKVAVTTLFANSPLYASLLLLLICTDPGFASACASSIMRSYYNSHLLTTSDTSYYAGILGFWSGAELAVGVFVCCLPYVPRFFTDLHTKVRSAISSLHMTIVIKISTNIDVKQEQNDHGQKTRNSKLQGTEKRPQREISPNMDAQT